MSVDLETRKETEQRLQPGPASPMAINWEYSASLESTDHVKVEDRYDLFIGGQFVAPHSKHYFKTINPATEEVLAEVAEADAEDVDRAVRAARKGYEKYWRKLRPA